MPRVTFVVEANSEKKPIVFNNLELKTKIKDIKLDLNKKLGAPVGNMKLYFKGTELKDE